MNQIPGISEDNSQTGRLRETSMRRKENTATQESAAVLASDHESKIRENPYPCFNDILIRLAILVKDIYVDQMNGRIYNRNGKEIPQWKSCGYMHIHLPGFGRNSIVTVHRVVYISAHMNEVLPCGYDVHHIDKNPENNCIFNLEALPVDVHTRNEVIQKLMQHSAEYAKLTGTAWEKCNITKDLVLALRVCIKYGGLSNCRKKGIVYRYFSEIMCIRRNYAHQIGEFTRGNSFAGVPTPEEIEYYLKEYAWLLNAIKAGDSYEQVIQRYPEKFDKGEPKEAEKAT